MIKKILLFSGILSCVKEFFLLWPTTIPIRFPVKFYILTVLFIFVYSSWYSGLFCIFFTILYLFYRILITFVFSSRYSRFTPACLGINFLWVRHHPNTEHPICQFCAAFSILIFTFPFSHFPFLLFPKSTLSSSMETSLAPYLEIISAKEKVEPTIVEITG